ncbi:MAG: beta-hexosaminidase [Bacilli bacterium]|nr:beta-hexosaminidase [Bacilli bacterium]
MSKKLILYLISVVALIILLVLVFTSRNKESKIIEIQGTILSVDNDTLTIKDINNVIYIFKEEKVSLTVGDSIVLEYSGLLDKTKTVQTGEIIDYDEAILETDENGIPLIWQDDGIFSDYYVLANNKLKELTLDEKIGQLLLARYPDSGAIEDLKKYNLSGFVFFEKDFANKTKAEVVNMIEKLQDASAIPLLTAVDEEGGKVVRVSSNPNLRSEKFKSSQELYSEGGFNLIKEDTKEKSELLKNLGLNLNLAPVVDVSTDSNSYIYPRTIGLDAKLTGEYAKTVIQASKGLGVSYTLKHFPGYGNNTDTHIESSTDNRTYDELLNDLEPFEVGINAGAEAVLVSHNTITSIDPDNVASLSNNVHNLLRGDLGFTGVVITDDISMSALNNLDNTTLSAILAGNNLVITTDYETSFNEIKNSIEDGIISEKYIDELAFKVLAWKYYKGLMIETK